ncbi:hypothetical protein MicloDRAFT_00005610 [Microvirga lotononidis]|uniref:Uncharacterized protein n=2 Tax=Microvirga lotononidis TaxID=864069 RepID=I4Z366_9HYPH|nr:hypothetical protein MicloDRAFT_00005610 [Microvirga lotononidis]
MAVSGLNNMAADTQDLLDDDAERLALVQSVATQINEAPIQEKSMILTPKNLPDRELNEALRDNTLSYFEAMEQSLALSMNGNDAKATELTNGSIRDVRRQLRDQITKSIDGIALELEQSKEDVNALALDTKWWLIGSAAVGLTLAIGPFCSITVFRVVRPLSVTTGAITIWPTAT